MSVYVWNCVIRWNNISEKYRIFASAFMINCFLGNLRWNQHQFDGLISLIITISVFKLTCFLQYWLINSGLFWTQVLSRYKIKIRTEFLIIYVVNKTDSDPLCTWCQRLDCFRHQPRLIRTNKEKVLIVFTPFPCLSTAYPLKSKSANTHTHIPLKKT